MPHTPPAAPAPARPTPPEDAETGRDPAAVGRFRIVGLTLAFLLAVFTLLRIALLVRFVDVRSLSFGEILRIMATGLRFDLLVALVFLVPQMLHMALHGDRQVRRQLSRLSIGLGLIATIAIALFLACAEFLFFDEFDARFNYIAFEYLVYPTEVAGNIRESYPLPAILGTIAVLTTAIYLFLRPRVRRALEEPLPMRRRLALLGGGLATIAVLAATTHAASRAITNDRVANECAGNGWWSFCYDALTSRFEYAPYYRTLPEADAEARVVRRIVGPDASLVPGAMNPLDRVEGAGTPRRDLNVVLVLEESFGSDFVGALGDDRGLTPRFDALAREGILFDRFHPTGNRTARALEATLASIPPIPTEAILKRDRSDRVWTLPRVLAERGYRTLFVYGGRGLFDGMRSFMLANGFERFVEQSDYADPTFVSAWGVCDEDIFDRALAEFDALDAEGRPFFGTVLTVSNHRPFTYPDGRIDLPSADQKREHAVKYADHALGRFFEAARTHAFHDHTMYVVVGDHGARVYGAEMFPIRSYRVPMLMILPDGEGAGTRCSTVGSMLDVPTTIMGRLGGAYRTVFFGRDLLEIDPADGYALMQHNHDLALLDADGVLSMLRFGGDVEGYRTNDACTRLDPLPAAPPERADDAAALFQLAHDLYYGERLFIDPDAHPALAQR